MFCHKCGAQVAEGAAFCHKCGAKVISEDATQQGANMLPTDDVPNNTSTPAVEPQQADTVKSTIAENTTNKSPKENSGLHIAANIGRVLMWGSLILLFFNLPISPAILVAGAAIGIILSALGAKRPLGLSKIIEMVVAVILLVVVAVTTLSSGGTGDKYVRIVKEGTLEAYPQMTVGEAFDGFLSDPKWESGLTDDHVRVVNVTGGILYYEKDAELAVQFFVDEKNETFQYNACEIDGVPQNNLVFLGLLETIYGDPTRGGSTTPNQSEMPASNSNGELNNFNPDDFYYGEKCLTDLLGKTSEEVSTTFGMPTGGTPVTGELLYGGTEYWIYNDELGLYFDNSTVSWIRVHSEAVTRNGNTLNMTGLEIHDEFGKPTYEKFMEEDEEGNGGYYYMEYLLDGIIIIGFEIPDTSSTADSITLSLNYNGGSGEEYPDTSSENNSSSLTGLPNGFEWIESPTGKTNEYSSTVSGIIQNTSQKTYSYLTISFNLYDSSGNQIGSASATIRDLQAGGSWKFEATGFVGNTARFEFSSIDGF